MTTEIRLAQYGMGMQDATIVQWHKKEGDLVEAGEIILEVEAAKTAVDVEAPTSGVLIRIVAQVDDVVPVGELLAEIRSAGDTVSAQDAVSLTVSARIDPPTRDAKRTGEPPAESATVQIEPRARRLAEQKGVNLSGVVGTGPQGRITEDDVHAHLVKKDASGSASAPAAPDADVELIPIKGLRRSIGRGMVDSLQSMAQLTLSSDADVTVLDDRRTQGGSNLSYTALVARAVVLALQQHPRMNATLVNEQLHVSRNINLGISVHTEHGLVAPVIHRAQDRDVGQIMEQIRSLAILARERRAKPDDFLGGTFTVTTLGQYGIDAFTPIIHPPQIAILGIGRVRERLARGEPPQWRKFVTLSLTFDHRATDGVPAALFLQTVRELLEAPEALFRA